MVGLGAGVLVLLAAVGLLAGIGITALGPGGVLVTIGLFALTNLAPSAVAGTAIVTHIGTGLLASAAYSRSGQLRQPPTRRSARVLAYCAIPGTILGVWLNSLVSTRVFGVLLGLFIVVVALLVLYRLRRGGAAAHRPHPPQATVTGLGFGVATVSGLVGVGGPMLAVPLLLSIGVPLLEGLAAAQVQSIVIATVGAVGYLAHDAIDWPLAMLVGVPELCGVLIGWWIARRVPTRALTLALVAALFLLAPYLALRS